MLRQRVITALVLVGLLLGTLLAPSVWPFALLTLVLIAAAGWEWGAAEPGRRRAGAGHGCGRGRGRRRPPWAAAGPNGAPAVLWWGVTALWLLCGCAGAARSGRRAWPQLPRPARWGLGLVALWAAWLALAHARVVGINFMLSVFCLVWVADVAAYFGGRAFGRRKLAPAISPGKSWEGVWTRHGRRAAAGAGLDLARPRFDVDGPSLYSTPAARPGLGRRRRWRCWPCAA